VYKCHWCEKDTEEIPHVLLTGDGYALASFCERCVKATICADQTCEFMDDESVEFLVRVIGNLIDVSAECLSEKYPEIGKQQIIAIVLDRIVGEKKRLDETK
jgi:hypothetical protein